MLFQVHSPVKMLSWSRWFDPGQDYDGPDETDEQPRRAERESDKRHNNTCSPNFLLLNFFFKVKVLSF